jgi:hypothetical protein
MGAGGLQDRHAACPQGQAGHAEHASDPRGRVAGPAAASALTLAAKGIAVFPCKRVSAVVDRCSFLNDVNGQRCGGETVLSGGVEMAIRKLASPSVTSIFLQIRIRPARRRRFQATAERRRQRHRRKAHPEIA